MSVRRKQQHPSHQHGLAAHEEQQREAEIKAVVASEYRQDLVQQREHQREELRREKQQKSYARKQDHTKRKKELASLVEQIGIQREVNSELAQKRARSNKQRIQTHFNSHKAEDRGIRQDRARAVRDRLEDHGDMVVTLLRELESGEAQRQTEEDRQQLKQTNQKNATKTENTKKMQRLWSLLKEEPGTSPTKDSVAAKATDDTNDITRITGRGRGPAISPPRAALRDHRLLRGTPGSVQEANRIKYDRSPERQRKTLVERAAVLPPLPTLTKEETQSHTTNEGSDQLKRKRAGKQQQQQSTDATQDPDVEGGTPTTTFGSILAQQQQQQHTNTTTTTSQDQDDEISVSGGGRSPLVPPVNNSRSTLGQNTPMTSHEKRRKKEERDMIRRVVAIAEHRSGLMTRDGVKSPQMRKRPASTTPVAGQKDLRNTSNMSNGSPVQKKKNQSSLLANSRSGIHGPPLAPPPQQQQQRSHTSMGVNDRGAASYLSKFRSRWNAATACAQQWLAVYGGGDSPMDKNASHGEEDYSHTSGDQQEVQQQLYQEDYQNQEGADEVAPWDDAGGGEGEDQQQGRTRDDEEGDYEVIDPNSGIDDDEFLQGTRGGGEDHDEEDDSSDGEEEEELTDEQLGIRADNEESSAGGDDDRGDVAEGNHQEEDEQERPSTVSAKHHHHSGGSGEYMEQQQHQQEEEAPRLGTSHGRRPSRRNSAAAADDETDLNETKDPNESTVAPAPPGAEMDGEDEFDVPLGQKFDDIGGSSSTSSLDPDYDQDEQHEALLEHPQLEKKPEDETVVSSGRSGSSETASPTTVFARRVVFEVLGGGIREKKPQEEMEKQNHDDDDATGSDGAWLLELRPSVVRKIIQLQRFWRSAGRFQATIRRTMREKPKPISVPPELLAKLISVQQKVADESTRPLSVPPAVAISVLKIQREGLKKLQRQEELDGSVRFLRSSSSPNSPLSPSSPFKKSNIYYRNDNRPRLPGTNMVVSAGVLKLIIRLQRYWRSLGRFLMTAYRRHKSTQLRQREEEQKDDAAPSTLQKITDAPASENKDPSESADDEDDYEQDDEEYKEENKEQGETSQEEKPITDSSSGNDEYADDEEVGLEQASKQGGDPKEDEADDDYDDDLLDDEEEPSTKKPITPPPAEDEEDDADYEDDEYDEEEVDDVDVVKGQRVGKDDDDVLEEEEEFEDDFEL